MNVETLQRYLTRIPDKTEVVFIVDGKPVELNECWWAPTDGQYRIELVVTSAEIEKEK